MTNQLWRPIESFWEYKTEVAEVRRLTQYNGRSNGIGIRMTYLRGRGKGETEFGGELLPADVRLCEAVPLPAPDWSQAPAWAMWWAVDAWGMSQFYESEPVLHETVSFCGWSRPTINGYQFGRTQDGAHIDIPLGVDWRLLKVRRPEL